MDSLIESDWNLVSFLAGIAVAWLWQRIKCAYKTAKTGKRVKPPKWNPILIAAGITAVGFFYMVSQNSTNAETVRRLAIDTAQCQQEFNRALKIRGAITQDNDHWSRVQREALAAWIHELIFPPPPYNTMAQSDPRREKWTIERTQAADKTIRQAQAEQLNNDVERSKPENQYPEPTCGSTAHNDK
jgi:hypothetical protein